MHNVYIYIVCKRTMGMMNSLEHYMIVHVLCDSLLQNPRVVFNNVFEGIGNIELKKRI